LFLLDFIILASLTALVLMYDFTFFPCSRPSEDRMSPLSIIADQTKLSIEDVEYLLMKSLSVSLLDSSHFLALGSW